MTTTPTDLMILREPDRIATLLDPDRRRLLDALGETPDSATGLARRLGDRRQRVNYHLRRLEEAGLVGVLEERPRRGLTERIMTPSARRFVVDSSALGGLSPTPEEEADQFSATYLVALAARCIREVATLLDRARDQGKRLPTLGLSSRVRLADPAALRDFQAELGEAVARVVAKHHHGGPGGRWFRVAAQSYPAPEEETGEERGNDGEAQDHTIEREEG